MYLIIECKFGAESITKWLDTCKVAARTSVAEPRTEQLTSIALPSQRATAMRRHLAYMKQRCDDSQKLQSTIPLTEPRTKRVHFGDSEFVRIWIYLPLVTTKQSERVRGKQKAPICKYFTYVCYLHFRPLQVVRTSIIATKFAFHFVGEPQIFTGPSWRHFPLRSYSGKCQQNLI